MASARLSRLSVSFELTHLGNPLAGRVSADFYWSFLMDAILAAVDLSAVAVFVGAAGVLVVGIALAFKGIGLAKRAVKAA
jgi:hypothetical protein